MDDETRMGYEEARAELRSELLAAGRPDIWNTVDSFTPSPAMLTDYHGQILMQAIVKRHGQDGLEILMRAVDRAERISQAGGHDLGTE
jgi:hypothetical protein